MSVVIIGPPDTHDDLNCLSDNVLFLKSSTMTADVVCQNFGNVIQNYLVRCALFQGNSVVG